MVRNFKDLPFRGDERPTRVVIELPSRNRELAVLTNGIDTRAVSQGLLTWGGDFNEYSGFKDLHGHWPTEKDQLGLRRAARKRMFDSGTPIPEETNSNKSLRN